MPEPFLLDTALLLHWTRGSPQARAVDQRLQMTTSELRPLVCEVSIGEMLAFSRRAGWGEKRRQRLAEIEQKVVVVPISDRRIMEAYADLSTLAHTSGWGLFRQKNDLWIGATAKAAGAHLLTMDKDFLPLRGKSGWSLTVLDPHTGEPIPMP